MMKELQTYKQKHGEQCYINDRERSEALSRSSNLVIEKMEFEISKSIYDTHAR